MKKRKIIIALAAVFAISALFGATSFALTPEEATKEYFQANDEVKTNTNPISHSAFTAGNNVENNNPVDGILFSAGNNVNSNGKTEYAFIAGNNVNINGETAKDLFAAGKRGNVVNINAPVLRDVYAAASVLSVNQNVSQNAFLAGGEIKIADNVVVNGNLSIDAEKISFGDNVKVIGVLSYNKEARVSNLNAANYGQVSTYENIKIENQEPSPTSKILLAILKFVSLFIIFALIILVFPKASRRFTDITKEVSSTAKQLGIGACALIITPIAVFLLLFTIIGIPLALILLAVYLIIICISAGITGAYAGHLVITRIFNAKSNPYGEVALGLLLMNLVFLVPVIGAPFAFLSACFGFGAAIDFAFAKKNKKEKSKEEIEEKSKELQTKTKKQLKAKTEKKK